MNNFVMRKIDVTASYQPLAANKTVVSVTISAPPTNSDNVLFKGDDGTADITFSNVAPNPGSANEKRWFYDTFENLLLQEFTGSWNTIVNFSTIPVFETAVNFNGNVALASNDATLTVGNQLGSPGLVLDKLDAGTIDVDFRNEGVNRYRLRLSGGENFVFERFNAAGASQDFVLVSASNGGWTFPADITLDNDTPTLTLGSDANGSGAMLDLRKDDANELRGPSYLNDGFRMFDDNRIFGLDNKMRVPGQYAENPLIRSFFNPLNTILKQPDVSSKTVNNKTDDSIDVIFR